MLNLEKKKTTTQNEDIICCDATELALNLLEMVNRYFLKPLFLSFQFHFYLFSLSLLAFAPVIFLLSDIFYISKHKKEIIYMIQLIILINIHTS